MDFLCEVCYNYINNKSKYMRVKSKSHKNFGKCEHIVLFMKNIDVKNVDEAFYLHIIEHNKKFDYYLVKCQFILVFLNYEYSPYIMSKLSNNKTMKSWKKFLGKVIEDFKDKGYNFNQIPEMHIVTIANKLDMTYDFYVKHIICAFEWKVKAMINKRKTLINKLNHNRRHPLNRIFESYRV